MLRHWSQLVPKCQLTSEDIKHHFIITFCVRRIFCAIITLLQYKKNTENRDLCNASLFCIIMHKLA